MGPLDETRQRGMQRKEKERSMEFTRLLCMRRRSAEEGWWREQIGPQENMKNDASCERQNKALFVVKNGRKACLCTCTVVLYASTEWKREECHQRCPWKARSIQRRTWLQIFQWMEQIEIQQTDPNCRCINCFHSIPQASTDVLNKVEQEKEDGRPYQSGPVGSTRPSTSNLCEIRLLQRSSPPLPPHL